MFSRLKSCQPKHLSATVSSPVCRGAFLCRLSVTGSPFGTCGGTTLCRRLVLAAVLCLAVAVPVTGGASPIDTVPPAAPLPVSATLHFIGEWVKAVGGDAVALKVITPSGADPHAYEPTARAIADARNAGIVFAIGLGMEPWLDRIARADAGLNVITLAPQKGLLYGEFSCGHDHAQSVPDGGNAFAVAVHGAESLQSVSHFINCDHSHAPTPDGSRNPAATPDAISAVVNTSGGNTPAACGHDHAAPPAAVSASIGNTPSTCRHDHSHDAADPHVWLDPVLVKAMVTQIAEELARLSPQHAALFAKNAENYRAKLDALDAAIRSALQSVPAERRKLVTNHNNMRYFGERYGFTTTDSLFGTQGSEGGQPSPRRIRAMVAIIRKEGIPALFADAWSGEELLQAVAQEAGLPAPVVLYSIPGSANSPAPDYLTMMRHNAAAIAKALATP